MRNRWPSARFQFTRHARDRQVERAIPTCLVRLAIDRGCRMTAGGRDRFMLGVAQLNAAGFGPTRQALAVVVSDLRIVTVMWVDAGAARTS